MDWTTRITDPSELASAFAGYPDARYRPITAWWWSGDPVTEDRMLWQLDRIRDLGCGGVAIAQLAGYGPSGGSRADEPRTASPEYLRLFRVMAERCREYGMGVVSGSPFQKGLPVDSKRLLTERPWLRGEIVHTRGGLRVQPFGYDFGSEEAIDALNEPGTVAATAFEALDDLLGDVMVAMFEDEIPAFPRWAPTFASEFKELKGYDPPPEVFDADVGPRTPAIRWDLFDVATTRVEGAYTRRLREWRERHGILAGYDQMSRRGTPLLTNAYYFDPFRTMSWANAPGTDQMGDARFHLSIADLQDTPRVWLEGFHSNGWGMRLSDQALLLFEWGREGANLYLPHGMYYSGRAFWWEWAPPEMGWKQPYARHYPAFAEAIGRLMMLLAAGRHVPEVAVLYPISTLWADTTGHLEWGDAALAAERTYCRVFGVHGQPSLWDPGRMNQPSVLADAFYDRIAVDEANVDAFDVPIVVPGCRCLRTQTVDRLIAGAERGRKVVVVEPVPEWSAEEGREDAAFAKRVARLLEVADVVTRPEDVPGVLPPPRVEGLKAQLRRVGDLDCVFLTGSGQVRLRGMAGRAPQRWDLRTGRIEPHPAQVDGDDLVLRCEGPQTFLSLPAGEPAATEEVEYSEIELPEVWDCEYLPWGENRWGDYRLPPNEGTPPTERRTFAHREGDDDSWRTAPVVPEDVQHAVIDLGFEERMSGKNGRVPPKERWLEDGWREVVSTYGPKAVLDEDEVVEYSERLGVEDILPTTPIGLKGWVEPWKVDLGQGGGQIASYGYVPRACDTDLVVEGQGILTVSLDGRGLIGPVEGGLLAIPVSLDEGWHEVVIEAEYRSVAEAEYRGHRPPPRTLLSWTFMERYHRAPIALWGGRVMHPDYKGSAEARRFRRRIVVPERAEVRVKAQASAPYEVYVPDVLEPGEHVVEAFVGEALVSQDFACELELRMPSATVWIGTDDRWETAAAGEQWRPAFPKGLAGTISWTQEGDEFPEPPRRSPLLDVGWLEGEEVLEGHAESAWSDSPDDPPPSWFCFTAPPGARSITLPVTGHVQAWVGGEEREIRDGVLELEQHARVALRVQAFAGHRGACCFREHPVLELGAGTIRTGLSWHRQGLDCFSGVILHRAEVDVPEAGEAVLDLGEVSGSVEVRINGERAGVLAWPPWTLPVTLRQGTNLIELEVANTLGPMASRGIPTPFGPEDQRITGILRRPRLLVVQR